MTGKLTLDHRQTFTKGPDQAPPVWLQQLAIRLRVDPAVLTDESLDIQFGPGWRWSPSRIKPYGRLALALWSGRFMWVGLGSQLLLGVFLLGFMAWRWLPELHGWWAVPVPVILALGSLAGWNISRRIDVRWTATGGSFSFPGMGSMMLFFIPLMILRIGFAALISHGVTAVLPLRDLLFFFVPGMLTTRGIVLVIKLRRLQKVFAANSSRAGQKA